MKKEFICIVCPRGCHISVDGDNISGNQCKRGLEYVKNELTSPTRVLTSTVKTTFDNLKRASVKTDRPIPKDLIFEAMRVINEIEINRPMNLGEIIIKNICDTEANLVLTREVN
ncbi:MAG: DUF1667 domain-containing protein [Candidatus Izemoplasmatales bacterium]|jgi:CxxC motif-containing protein